MVFCCESAAKLAVMWSNFDPLGALWNATRPEYRNFTAAGLHPLNLMNECSFVGSLALELLGYCVIDMRIVNIPPIMCNVPL